MIVYYKFIFVEFYLVFVVIVELMGEFVNGYYECFFFIFFLVKLDRMYLLFYRCFG